MDHDRLDMLKCVSFMNKNRYNLFKDYIPNHYDEIYSLFSLLDKAKVNYHDIEFDKPEEKDESFIFLFSLSEKNKTKIINYLEKNNNIVKFMRKKDFNVELPDANNEITTLVFKRL